MPRHPADRDPVRLLRPATAGPLPARHSPAELLAAVDAWLYKLAGKLARRHCLDRDDLHQAARLQVLAKAHLYDAGVSRPTTWASRVIFNLALRMRDVRAKHDRATPVDHADLDWFTSVPPVQATAEADVLDALDAHLSLIPARERDVIRRRYGLDGAPPESLAAIGQSFGVSKERIRQMEHSALYRLGVRLDRFRPDYSGAA